MKPNSFLWILLNYLRISFFNEEWKNLVSVIFLIVLAFLFISYCTFGNLKRILFLSIPCGPCSAYGDGIPYRRLIPRQKVLSWKWVLNGDTSVQDLRKVVIIQSLSLVPGPVGITFLVGNTGPLGLDTFWPTVLSGTRIRSGVFWLGGCRSRLPYAAPEETQHPHLMADSRDPWASGDRAEALTLYGGARFMSLRLRHPLLEEWWQGLKHFGTAGHVYATFHNKKKALCRTQGSVGRSTNTCHRSILIWGGISC